MLRLCAWTQDCMPYVRCDCRDCPQQGISALGDCFPRWKLSKLSNVNAALPTPLKAHSCVQGKSTNGSAPAFASAKGPLVMLDGMQPTVVEVEDGTIDDLQIVTEEVKVIALAVASQLPGH